MRCVFKSLYYWYIDFGISQWLFSSCLIDEDHLMMNWPWLFSQDFFLIASSQVHWIHFVIQRCFIYYFKFITIPLRSLTMPVTTSYVTNLPQFLFPYYSHKCFVKRSISNFIPLMDREALYQINLVINITYAISSIISCIC